MRTLRAVTLAALAALPAAVRAETRDEAFDVRIEVDIDFADPVRRRFTSPEDFAGAYVVAHEIWHNALHQSNDQSAFGRRALAATGDGGHARRELD